MTSRRATSQPPLVLHVIYSLGAGGLENGLVNIINRSPKDRYRHAIVCLTESGAFAQRLSDSEVQVFELHKAAGHDLRMYWRLWRLIRRLRPSLVHTRNLAALETQLLGVCFPRCRRVHGEHGRDMEDLEGKNRKYRMLRRILQPLVHRYITVSRDLYRWLIEDVQIPPRKVRQIYNGVDGDRFNARRAKDHARQLPTGLPWHILAGAGEIVVGSVGRLVPVKSQDTILEAVHRLREESPELGRRLRCVLVGEGPERANLEQRIHQLRLEDCVVLAGEREDIPDLLACMDIFLLPSLGEGISNTILEAMAAGLPVIASDVGGNPELVQQEVTGLLVGTRDVAALSAAIARLAADPELRIRMGNAARKRIDADFSWENAVSSYLSVYDELLPRSCLGTQSGGPV